MKTNPLDDMPTLSEAYPQGTPAQQLEFARRESSALIAAINELDLTPEQKSRVPTLYAKHWKRLGGVSP